MKDRVKIQKIVLLSVIVIGGLICKNSFSQGAVDLRINEILLYNDSSYVDDYGKHSTWIELFNSGYSTIDLGGLFLTNNISQPTKYKIDKGNVMTIVPPRSYFVVWADGEPQKGLRHLNFKLSEGETLALFDANGRTLIDSVTISSNQRVDISYGRAHDGIDEWTFLESSSPMMSNSSAFQESGADLFGKVDPTGVGMMAIAMSVVFSALALLFIVFKYMSRILNREKTRAAKREKVDVNDLVVDEISGEVNAAIALALHLYTSQLHDYEDTVLTINKVSRTYSPWSSKIYGIRQCPR